MRRPAAAAAIVALAGCAVPVPEVALPTLGLTPADRFLGAASGASVAPGAAAPEPGTDLGIAWWRRFDDPVVGQWVERALAANPDIAIARERVVQASSRLRQAGGARWPVVAGTIRSEHGGAFGGADEDRQPTATIGADWTPDLWGTRRQAERSAAAQVLRNDDLLRATRLSVAGTTARAVIAWREAQADEILLESALRVQRDVLNVVQSRVDAGLAPRLDRERARAEIAAVRAEAAVARVRTRQTLTALQILAGERPAPDAQGPRLAPAALKEGTSGGAASARASRPPAPGPSGAASPGRIPVLTADPPDTLPIDLLRARPDLRAAENAAIAAAAEVGVARGELLPTLRLQGTLAFTSGAAVFDRVDTGLAALLDAVLFDGGVRRARIDASESVLRETLDVYRRTLLEALQQVEDALVARSGLLEQIEGLTQSLAAADAAVEQARALYSAGLSGFIDVLDARRTALRQRRELVRARASAASQGVAVFEAMGVGADADRRLDAGVRAGAG